MAVTSGHGSTEPTRRIVERLRFSWEGQIGNPLMVYGFTWAGIGAFLGAMLASMGPPGSRADSWTWGMNGALIGFAGGFALNALTIPRARRWMALVVGIVLVAFNVFPEPDFFARLNGGPATYDWSENSRLGLAIGVVLVVVAVLTKPQGERF
jgi:hypothetical protein